MHGFYSKVIKPIHFTGDIAIINASFFLSYYLVYGEHDSFVSNHYFSLLIFYNASWFIVTSMLKAYHFYRTQPYITLLNSLFKLIFFFILVQEIFNRWVTVFDYPHKFFLLTYAWIGFLIPLWRLVTVFSLRIYRRKGFNFRRVVMVCSDTNSCSELKEFFEIHPEHGYRLYRIFDAREKSNVKPLLIEELKKYCKDNEIDEIYSSYAAFEIKEINEIVDFANRNLIRVKFMPDVIGFALKQFKVDFYDYIPIFVIKPTPLDDPINKIFKRIFDILFSMFALIFVFSWLAPLIALFIKFDSKGPIFFRQKRSGLDNKDFECYKFRTMYVNSEADIIQATNEDPRITKTGAILRKISLDELPQFFNVLLGNMSVVGPRPHMLKHTHQYSNIINKYMMRHFIRPGITGLAQIKGYRGETTDPSQMDRRIKMDVFYMENWSFLMDVKIILLTLIKL